MSNHDLPYTVLDLFAGIGGFSLGLERTGGFETKLFCEMDPFCQKVLSKHWPDVPIHDDVTTLHGEIGQFDVITGGFPCQDISYAGKGAGIEGERSGLWSEFARLIRKIRPKFVIVENVSALLNRGMGVVLGDLAEIGYDAEWDMLRASRFGAAHRRERVFVVAYPNRDRLQGGVLSSIPRNLPRLVDTSHRFTITEPFSIRTGHGIPNYVDRVKSIGNAVVPQISEWIGNQILCYASDTSSNDSSIVSPYLGAAR